MDPSDEAQAKELFFSYDGSRFYMSRDGVEKTYSGFDVPPETEREWLAELTETRVRELDGEDNWRALHFLIHHDDYRHLGAVVAASPKGKLWQRCSYLENLLTYLKKADQRSLVSAGAMESALESVARQCAELGRRARSDKSRRRVEHLAREVEIVTRRIERRVGAGRRGGLRLAFDLDGTLVPGGGPLAPGVEPLPMAAGLFLRERLRVGTRELLRDLHREGHEIWIYTSSLRPLAYLRWWFRLARVPVTDVVNHGRHRQAVAGLADPPSKHPPSFGIDLLVDDSPGVAAEGLVHGFRVVEVDPDDPEWATVVREAVTRTVEVQ